MLSNIRLKQILSIASFIAGIVFGMMGLWIAPQGIIHSSVLIMVGQLLILSATFLGLKVDFDLRNQHFTNMEKKSKDKEKEDIEE